VVARHSALEFVDDESSQEQLLAISDALYQVPIRERTISRSSAVFDLGKLHSLVDVGLYIQYTSVLPTHSGVAIRVATSVPD